MIFHNFLFFASIVAAVMMMTMMTATTASPFYSGTWRLDELYDDGDAPVTLPKGQEFVMSLKPAEDISTEQQQRSSDSEQQQQKSYQISITIGNILNTHVTMADPTVSPTNVQIKFVRSTMMLPPQELYKLEMFLTDALPKMETFTLDEPVLTMQGSAAKIVFTRQEV